MVHMTELDRPAHDHRRGPGADPRGPRAASRSPRPCPLARGQRRSGGAFTYDMYFRPLDEAGDAGRRPARRRPLGRGPRASTSTTARGATLDLSRRRPGDAEPEQPAARAATLGAQPPDARPLRPGRRARSSRCSTQQINPQIAAHGGLRRAGRGRGTGRLPAHGRRLPGLRHGRGHAVAGHRGRDPRRRCPRSPRWSTSPTTPPARTRTTRPPRSSATARSGEARGASVGGVAARPAASATALRSIAVDRRRPTLRRRDRARHLGGGHAGAHAAQRAADARGDLALLLGDRDDVALRLALDAQARDRVRQHHQLLAVEAQQHDVGVDRASRRAARR